MALSNALPEYLLSYCRECILAKFVVDRQDPTRAGVLGMAA